MSLVEGSIDNMQFFKDIDVVEKIFQVDDFSHMLIFYDLRDNTMNRWNEISENE